MADRGRSRSRSAHAWRINATKARLIGKGGVNDVLELPKEDNARGGPASRSILRYVRDPTAPPPTGWGHSTPQTKEENFIKRANTALAEKRLGELNIIPQTYLLNAKFNPEDINTTGIVQQMERYDFDLSKLPRNVEPQTIELMVKSLIETITRFAQLGVVYFDINDTNMGVFLSPVRVVMSDVDLNFCEFLPTGLRARCNEICPPGGDDFISSLTQAIATAVMLALLLLHLEQRKKTNPLIPYLRAYILSFNAPIAELLQRSQQDEGHSEFWKKFKRTVLTCFDHADAGFWRLFNCQGSEMSQAPPEPFASSFTTFGALCSAYKNAKQHPRKQCCAKSCPPAMFLHKFWPVRGDPEMMSFLKNLIPAAKTYQRLREERRLVPSRRSR